MNQEEKLGIVLEKLLSLRKEIDETIAMIDVLPKTSNNINEKAKAESTEYFDDNSKIIEGIFNGEIMIGPDGKQYSIPTNYISKSKIVEGDKMKLTIKKDGTFIYKLIDQVKRVRAIGTLSKDESGKGYIALINGRAYKVQKASVTYYKGEVGDEVVAILPEGGDCTWAAIENITKEKIENNISEVKNTVETPIKDNIENIKSEPKSLDINSLNQVTPISLDDIE